MSHNIKAQTQVTHVFLNYFVDFGIYACIYIRHMYIAVYLRYHVSLLVNINIFYMTPQRATWKNSNIC